MKQDKAEKIIKKAELKAKKAAQQVEAAGKKAEAAKKKQEARIQKKAEQAQKKASKKADAAAKKAAKKTQKAEAVAKKAQLAAKKAEEKKAKAVAKAAARATAGGKPSGEGGEGGGAAAPKKKGKKKLLMIAVPVVAAAVGVGAFFFLKGGGEDEEVPLEPIPAPIEYVLNERSITALPVWGDEVLVYREELTPKPPAEPEDDGDAKDSENEAEGEGEAEPTADSEEESAAASEEETEVFTKILYRYEGLQSPADLVSAYAALMTTADAGFSTVDETLLRIDPPEEFGARGTVQLARNVPAAEDGTGGGVQSLLLSWDAVNCSVTLDMPEGKVHDPAPEPTPAASARRGLSDLKTIHPSKLGLPGESMEAYELIPQDGSVLIAKSACMRVNIFDEDSQIVGSYFLSMDGKLYKLDESVNAVVELDWE